MPTRRKRTVGRNVENENDSKVINVMSKLKLCVIFKIKIGSLPDLGLIDFLATSLEYCKLKTSLDTKTHAMM